MEDRKTYELGYLLSPLVAGEVLSETVEKEIKQALTAAGAEIKKELEPRLRPLAYEIKKIVEHKGSTFREAYFGALAFVAAPSAIAEIESKLKKSTMIVRHMLMILPAAAFITPKPRVAPTGAEPAPEGDKSPVIETGEKMEKAPKGKKKMSTEALDQEIDQLLVSPK
jgi:ribosomal protein S6